MSAEGPNPKTTPPQAFLPAASLEVDLIGLEPTTSSMPWKRSPN